MLKLLLAHKTLRKIELYFSTQTTDPGNGVVLHYQLHRHILDDVMWHA